MTLAPGEVFAGYTIERALGAGGMGEVYLVQHPRLPRQYALKILTPGLADDADFRERFNREAEAAAALWHPHIVGVHDRGEDDGRLWIAMDYVDGTDASALLAPNGLPVSDVAEIVTAVAEALDHAHEHRLLHRDVKPANILLSGTEPGRRRILLGDFGIARHADDISGLTATNAIIGTVAYAAPEQLLGRPLDERTDQYSLAATAFHLLTGKPPFADSNPAVVIGMHLSAPPPRLSAVRPDLARLDETFARALSKEPADRYPRCADFARALSQAASAPAPSVPPAPWTLPVATLPAAAPVAVQQPWLPPIMPAPQRKSRRMVAIIVPLVLVVLMVGATTFAVSQFLRPGPRPSTAAPEWQPYVDAGASFAVSLMSISSDTADDDVRRILDGSTGKFHDEFASSQSDFVKTIRASNVRTTARVGSAGLESIDGTTAVVLVAATSEVTNNTGANNQPRNWRLRLTMVKVGDNIKGSNVEYVS